MAPPTRAATPDHQVTELHHPTGRILVEAELRRGFDVAWSRYQRETAEFHAERIATVAKLLGIPPHKVGPADIRYCRRVHGRPGPIDDAPVLRHDWRYGPRLPTKRRD